MYHGSGTDLLDLKQSHVEHDLSHQSFVLYKKKFSVNNPAPITFSSMVVNIARATYSISSSSFALAIQFAVGYGLSVVQNISNKKKTAHICFNHQDNHKNVFAVPY